MRSRAGDDPAARPDRIVGTLQLVRPQSLHRGSHVVFWPGRPLVEQLDGQTQADQPVPDGAGKARQRDQYPHQPPARIDLGADGVEFAGAADGHLPRVVAVGVELEGAVPVSQQLLEFFRNDGLHEDVSVPAMNADDIHFLHHFCQSAAGPRVSCEQQDCCRAPPDERRCRLPLR